jgi:hypothetical protein
MHFLAPQDVDLKRLLLQHLGLIEMCWVKYDICTLTIADACQNIAICLSL